MNFWVLMYIIFAPLFGIVVFVYFNRRTLLKKWWLFKHPQTVYKVIFYYPNKMFVERFISTRKEFFDFDKGTYNVNKESMIRKNWLGLKGKQTEHLDENNTIDFEQYKIWFKDQIEDLPNKAQIIGELHYIVGLSNPINYPGVDEISKEVKGEEVIKTSLSRDQHKVGKSNVLQQLINANFNKGMMILIVALVFISVGLCALLVAYRLELIEAPLHVVCVNVGGGA